MSVIAQNRRPLIPLVKPDRERLLSEPIERCGHCMLLWPAADFVEEAREDGLRRACPNAASPSTDLEYVAGVKESVADQAERYQPMPNVSDAPLPFTIPATVTTITDTDGGAVYNGEPLRIVRGSSVVMKLIGRNFTSADVISYSYGITASIARTTSLTTLTLTAAADATTGTQNVTFNGSTLKGVLRVR